MTKKLGTTYKNGVEQGKLKGKGKKRSNTFRPLSTATVTDS